jgi:hypothetical protein
MKPFEPIFRLLVTLVVVISLSFGLSSCSDRISAATPFEKDFQPLAKQEGTLVEVSPPSVLKELNQSLQKYQPQVKILSPRPEETLNDTTIKVQLQVKDFPLFENKEKGLSPHLHLILDNEPYQPIYNVDQPITLENISPGTHTLRVFAVRPWHESFKNNGAYAQSTFHVLTKTEENSPDRNLPLLTYSRPKGTYGAEPIMLDFYLTNTPLHLVAQENPEDEVADWRIKVTINGQTFLLDSWQPVYLKGFKKGNNWVKLEFIDESGTEVKNVFNNTVRLIKYEPKGQDTFSKMMRGELTFEQLKDIVDPTYIPPAITEPVAEPEEIAPVESEPEPLMEKEETTEVTPDEIELEVRETEVPETTENLPELEAEIEPEIPETSPPTIEEQVEEIAPAPTEITEEPPIIETEKIETSAQENSKILTEEIEKEEEHSEAKSINTQTLESPSVMMDQTQETPQTSDEQKTPEFVKNVTNFWNNLLKKTN